MDYGQLITRALEIVWNNKFLIVLGIIFALFGGRAAGNGGGANFNLPSGGGDSSGEFDFGDGDFNFGDEEFNFDDFDSEQLAELAAVGGATIAIIAVVLCFVLIIGLALLYVGLVAEGGMIAGVNQIEIGGDGSSSFKEAWSAGWARGVPLFIINFLMGLPVLVLVIVALVLIVPVILAAGSFSEATGQIVAGGGILAIIIALLCLSLLIGIPLSILRQLAVRACVLEEKGTVEALGRGWEIFTSNVGEVLITAVIRFGLGIGVGIVAAIATIILIFTCIGILLVPVIGGAVQAVFSAYWTLAWREWAPGSGAPSLGEPVYNV